MKRPEEMTEAELEEALAEHEKRLHRPRRLDPRGLEPDEPIPQEYINRVKDATAYAQRVVDTHAQAIIEDREASHGDYTKQSRMSQALREAFRTAPSWNKLTPPQRESLDMIAVKLSRILYGDPNVADHWTDLAGYATLVSNLLTKGTHL